MAERKGLSKKIRFEVFKRDNFTCQYCGRTAPDVILEVDHIKAVKNGGTNDIMNLVTSCFECNRGKGKRKLNDNAEIKAQINQLKEINQKREQLELLLKWKEELGKFEDEQVEKINSLLIDRTGYGFNQNGKSSCLKEIKKYGFEEVYESTIISINQYYDERDEESVNKVFNSIGKICSTRKRQKNDPTLYEINYLCKITKNRFGHENHAVRAILKRYYKREDFEELKDYFRECYNYSSLLDVLDDMYGEEDNGDL